MLDKVASLRYTIGMDKYKSNLPELMFTLGFDRMALVRSAGISYPTASKVHNGSLDISALTFFKVCDALGIDRDIATEKIEQPLED